MPGDGRRPADFDVVGADEPMLSHADRRNVLERLPKRCRAIAARPLAAQAFDVLENTVRGRRSADAGRVDGVRRRGAHVSGHIGLLIDGAEARGNPRLQLGTVLHLADADEEMRGGRFDGHGDDASLDLGEGQLEGCRQGLQLCRSGRLPERAVETLPVAFGDHVGEQLGLHRLSEKARVPRVRRDDAPVGTEPDHDVDREPGHHLQTPGDQVALGRLLRRAPTHSPLLLVSPRAEVREEANHGNEEADGAGGGRHIRADQSDGNRMKDRPCQGHEPQHHGAYRENVADDDDRPDKQDQAGDFGVVVLAARPPNVDGIATVEPGGGPLAAGSDGHEHRNNRGGADELKVQSPQKAAQPAHCCDAQEKVQEQQDYGDAEVEGPRVVRRPEEGVVNTVALRQINRQACPECDENNDGRAGQLR
mmetsp:Transcript_10256/g.21029  ORF Transcript_10256/g.21029 Transcript_10256/m.21029 type:complete len:421 (+) Transcript_10256:509-1771(+)